jgi:hypothetical protein
VVVNPRHALLETLNRRAVAITRAIHAHPEAKVGPAKTEKNKSTKQRQAAQTIDDSDDDLVSRPPAAH